MILRDQLYSVYNKKKEGDSFIYTIELNPQHFIYKAHFPSEPITPGVCIVQIAKELLEDALGEMLEIKIVKNVKFISTITPDKNIHVVFKIDKISDTDKGDVKMQSLVCDKDVLLSKISLICRRTNNDN